MSCNTPIFQDWANNNQIMYATGADMSTGDDRMDDANGAKSFFT